MNQTSEPPVVEAAALTKVFRDFWRRPKVKAVMDLSFEIRPGEVFGLLGPNGSGKSTTIKMILGLLYPTRGRVRILGRSPLRVAARRDIGYLPEESHLVPYLTCAETLHFFGRLFNLDRRERARRVDELLDMVGLRYVRRRLVGELSKGMARRLGLAQALINDPRLLVLDEPTSGLDPLGARQVKELIARLADRGKTVLLTSHLLADVEDVCHRILILFNGRAQAAGPIDELLTQRDRHRVNLPELAPGQLDEVRAQLRVLLGAEPVIEHPRMDLETFFLEVVARARAGAHEPGTGAEGERGIAAYLADAPAGGPRDRGQALVHPPEPAGPAAGTHAAPPAQPGPSGPDDRRLNDLLPPGT